MHSPIPHLGPCRLASLNSDWLQPKEWWPPKHPLKGCLHTLYKLRTSGSSPRPVSIQRQSQQRLCTARSKEELQRLDHLWQIGPLFVSCTENFYKLSVERQTSKSFATLQTQSPFDGTLEVAAGTCSVLLQLSYSRVCGLRVLAKETLTCNLTGLWWSQQALRDSGPGRVGVKSGTCDLNSY